MVKISMTNVGSKTRWMIMICSFLVLVYGKLFISTSSTIVLPVFNCPYNLNAAIEGSCLYITEWKDYLIGGNIFASIGKPLLIYGSTIGGILLFGKLWCGYVCPFGFIQELLYKIRAVFNIKTISFTQKHKDYFKLIKYALLAIFLIGLGFCEICPVRFVLPPLSGVATRLDIGIVSSVIVLALALFSERFFCRVCPMGAFIGLFHKITPWKLKKNCTSCTECGICYEVCPMDIKEIYTEREKENVTDSDCIFCNKCIDNCPEKDALSLAFLDKKVLTSNRKKYYKNNL